MSKITVDKIHFPYQDVPLLSNDFDTKRHGIKTSMDILHLPKPIIISKSFSSLYSTMVNSTKNLEILEGNTCTTIRDQAMSLLRSIEIVENSSYNPADLTLYVDLTTSNSKEKTVQKLITYPQILTPESSIFLSSLLIREMKETNYHEHILRPTTKEIIPLLSELIISNEIDLRIGINAVKRRQQKLYETATILRNLQKDLDMNLTKQQKEKTLAAFNFYTSYFNALYFTLALYSKYLQNPKEMKNEILAILEGNSSTQTLINSIKSTSDAYYTNGIKEYTKLIK